MHSRLIQTALTISLFLILSLLSGNPATSAISQLNPAKRDGAQVDAWVLEKAETGEVEFLVYLKTQADLRPAAALQNKTEKGRFVYQALTHTANQTQAPLVAALEQMGVAYQSFWIANMIWVRGDAAVLEALANRPDIANIFANPAVQMPEITTAPSLAPAHPAAAEALEWNLLKIQAGRVWSAGVKGQGVVVGGQDTGYEWNHPALAAQYRGWDGASSNHNYNWHDAIHGDNPRSFSGNPCGFDSPQPCDDHGHGTHTMGILIGDDGGANQVGVAPKARWIGCRNMEQGWGTPASYAECYQWFLAPTDLDGMNADSTQAPDIINNSWGCPPSEGCTDPTVLQVVVEAVRAAGILSVHSAGNSGPTCGSINTPAAIYDASFTVGNTTAADILASNSSRGPVLVDGSGRLKPDVAAPGTDIRSAWLNGSYAHLSGTSMAGPHAAGLAALLLSAQPALRGQVDALEALIEQSAVPVSTSQAEVCGGILSTTRPNNSFGWGRIDAWAAFQALFPYRYYFPAFFSP